MEKQPVDDLFARKLRDAEAPVGPDVFSQLQKRMGAKPLPTRRSLIAWWQVAGAACLLAALWFLYVISKPEHERNVPIAHKQLPKANETDKIADNGNRLISAPQGNRQTENRRVESRITTLNEIEATAKATYPDRKLATTITKSIEKELIPARQSNEQVVVVQPHEIQPVSSVPALAMSTTPIERIDRVSNQQKPTSERTILMTIEEPQLETKLASTKDNASVSDSQSHQNGLSGLFGKLKQLKNGEVLAKAIPAANQNTQKHRFGRVFTEVKESLKNETTLE